MREAAVTPNGWRVTIDPSERFNNEVRFGDHIVAGWTNGSTRGNATREEALRDADKIIGSFKQEIEHQSQGVLL